MKTEYFAKSQFTKIKIFDKDEFNRLKFNYETEKNGKCLEVESIFLCNENFMEIEILMKK